MNDSEIGGFIITACLVCILVGFMIGNVAASFNIPTMKIWESNRSYDHLLIADDVICKPMNEVNASYYKYETVVYNRTEYVYKKVRIDNTSVKGIIVCTGGKP